MEMRSNKESCENATNSDEGFALLVLKNIWDEWCKVNEKEVSAKYRNKYGFNVNNQEEDNGLHILRVLLHELEDETLMKSRDSMSYVLYCKRL